MVWYTLRDPTRSVCVAKYHNLVSLIRIAIIPGFMSLFDFASLLWRLAVSRYRQFSDIRYSPGIFAAVAAALVAISYSSLKFLTINLQFSEVFQRVLLLWVSNETRSFPLPSVL